MIRALIVDDEPVARRGILRRLESETDIEVIGECGSGAAAIDAIGTLLPDLVFLDIQMPELGGFDVIDAFGVANMPAVIFVTAYDEHALRAFDVHAVDYVLKPIDRARFLTALDRARQRLSQKRDELGAPLAAALEDLGRTARGYSKRLAIKSTGRVTIVEIDDVDRIEAAGNYVEVHVGPRHHLYREPMVVLEKRLDPAQFVRVSRSSIVNAGRVREVQMTFSGDFLVVMRDGTKVTGSRRYREGFNALTR